MCIARNIKRLSRDTRHRTQDLNNISQFIIYLFILALYGLVHYSALGTILSDWPSLLIAHVFILCIIMHYFHYCYCYRCMLFVIVVSSSWFSGSDLFTSFFLFLTRFVFTHCLFWTIVYIHFFQLTWICLSWMPRLEWLHYTGFWKQKCCYSS